MASSKFTYNPNVPQATQLIKSTQLPIENNFESINDFINVNHVGFSDPTNYGKHIYTTLPFQGSDPSTSATQMALYCKATPSGPNTAEIFYRYPSNGTVQQLTGGTGGGIAATSGYAYLSSTVFMVWGTATGIITGANVITFPTVGFPAIAAVYQIYYQPNVNYSNVSAATYIATSSTVSWTLQVPNSNYATSVYWMAIASTV